MFNARNTAPISQSLSRRFFGSEEFGGHHWTRFLMRRKAALPNAKLRTTRGRRPKLLEFECLLAVVVAGKLDAQTVVHPIHMTLQTDVPVTMRDGVVLRADVYMPTAVGKVPVLLVRTPYDNSGEAETCTEAAQRGYICIAQEVRGRYRSEGEWYPFKHESDDGYDTIEWAAALPNSNWKVAMFGESYVGATQWLAALAEPPHLIAIQPSLTASDYHEGWVYQGGALEQWFDQS
jgi:predicted acyl esterase